MKRILYSICIGSLALTVAAWGQNDGDTHKKKESHKKPAGQHASAPAKNRATNHANHLAHQQPQQGTPQAHSNSVARQSQPGKHPTRTSHKGNLSTNNKVQAQNHRQVSRQTNSGVNGTRTVNATSEPKLAVNQHRSVIVSNNWQGQSFTGQQYAAFRNYHRESHNRNWWTSHNDRIVLVSGGWYSWNVAGFWFPAFGYAPGYNYPYYGPIYGYNNLGPDQVVINVQTQLQGNGYYSGATDGILGPRTRQAIGSFQADHGLAVTSAVDQPTLAELGLI